MEPSYEAGRTAPPVQYELTINPEEAILGSSRILTRNNKRIEVKIPAAVKEGQRVKLNNAQQLTDGRPGDIYIVVKIKSERPARAEEQIRVVVEVSDGSFNQEVLKAGLPVVVDFWAAWCGPCKMMAPVLDQAAEDYAGKFKFCKINVDENPQMASRYRAESIPMLLVFRKGEVVDKIVGAVPAEHLKAKLDSLL